MTEKALEKKGNMLTNLQIFGAQLISNEDKICILQVEKSFKTKFVKLQSRSAIRGNCLITRYRMDKQSVEINK